MQKKTSVYDILSELNYELIDKGKEYRAQAKYRDGDNPTCLSIDKNTGRWRDFKEGTYGRLTDLIQLTLNTKSIEDAQTFLKNRNFQPKISESNHSDLALEEEKTFEPEELTEKIEDHSYWEGRGIKYSVINKFNGGVMHQGKMAKRYIFPIYNSQAKILGVTGRDITGNSTIKWKHLGVKANWVYPALYNYQIIKEKKEVYLVESIGDMLSLWQAGIKNTLVTFGLTVSSKIISFLIKVDPNKIYLSFNNDSGNNFAGNKAAEKAVNKLCCFFDEQDLKIKLPSKNDFGEMTKEEILKWVK